jgi:hypothetical protein
LISEPRKDIDLSINARLVFYPPVSLLRRSFSGPPAGRLSMAWHSWVHVRAYSG